MRSSAAIQTGYRETWGAIHQFASMEIMPENMPEIMAAWFGILQFMLGLA
jgi:hypothetical protein